MDTDRLEAERLATLRSLQILDTAPEQEFDAIVTMARDLLGSPIALISLVDDTRQWFKARVGVDATQTPREQAFCAHAMLGSDIMMVQDATRDARFAHNPLVTGNPNIRFYAGMPISAKNPCGDNRLPIGTLCVIGDAPRELDEAGQRTLRALASLAEALIDARAATNGATRLAEQYQGMVDRLDRSVRLFKQAERMAHIGGWRLMLADNQVVWSEGTFAIHGLPVSETVSLATALDHYPPAARATIEDAVADTIATGKPFDREVDFVDAQGHAMRVRSIGELEIKDGVPTALVGVFQDITERHQMEQRLRDIAETDDLTRIASRSRFNAFLDTQIAVARDAGTPLAVLLIDLDHFKEVNDRCGHAAGDDLLRLMASRLRAPYLETSFAARLGGDEFVMVVTDPAILADLPDFLRRILADLRHTVSRGHVAVRVSATIGAAFLTPDITSRGDLLECADDALYQAKDVQRGTAAICGTDEIIRPVRKSDRPSAPAYPGLKLVG